MKDFLFFILHCAILITFYFIFKPIEDNLYFAICVLSSISYILGFIKGKLDD